MNYLTLNVRALMRNGGLFLKCVVEHMKTMSKLCLAVLCALLYTDFVYVLRVVYVCVLACVTEAPVIMCAQVCVLMAPKWLSV